jgi:hypothetical protein
MFDQQDCICLSTRNLVYFHEQHMFDQQDCRCLSTGNFVEIPINICLISGIADAGIHVTCRFP